MKITREYQMNFINNKLKELGKSRLWLANKAGVKYGNITDFYRGKASTLSSPNWEAIKEVLSPGQGVVPVVGVMKEYGKIFPVDGKRLK